MPICTSSESRRITLSMRSRLTYVPLRLPASATENSPPSRVNTAWRRDTVTSSRKISLSLCRPAVTSSWSSRNRLPALGPFCTTSIALPVGSASTAAASTGLRCRSEVSDFSDGVPMLIVAVASSAPGWLAPAATSWVPQLAQKRASSGFCLPQAVQNGIGEHSSATGTTAPTLRRELRVMVSPNLPAGPGRSRGDQAGSRGQLSRLAWYAAESSSASSELASLTVTSKSQPPPYGSLLTSSGVASRDSLRATTVPETGA